MKLLSIETTSSIGSIAVVENFNLLKEITFKSDDIASCLVENLENINGEIKISDFDYFIVSIGPGSWTGIRTGISFVKGIACGKREKIYAVSLPDSLFFILKDFRCKLICVVNAYRENFYISKYNCKFNFKKSFPIKTFSKKIVKNILKKEDYIPIGPGVNIFLNNYKKDVFKFPVYPLASYNAFLAYEKIKRGIKSPPLEPYYGR